MRLVAKISLTAGGLLVPLGYILGGLIVEWFGVGCLLFGGFITIVGSRVRTVDRTLAADLSGLVLSCMIVGPVWAVVTTLAILVATTTAEPFSLAKCLHVAFVLVAPSLSLLALAIPRNLLRRDASLS